MAKDSQKSRTTASNQVLSILGSAVKSLFAAVIVSALAATVFTLLTPSGFLSRDAREQLQIARATLEGNLTPTLLPATPDTGRKRIGIVAGHHEYDSGAVCPDGLTEAQVNLNIAQQVVKGLASRGYDVDLLAEDDDRIEGYHADALISIHADSCEYINDQATGYKAAHSAVRTSALHLDQRLLSCVVEKYGQVTGLPYHAYSITPDMQLYHSFRKIAPDTPSIIIEVGFLYLDRDILTNHSDAVALGIIDGVLCFLEPPPTATPDLIPAASTPNAVE